LRFTSVDLLASVAPKRPGWQRHISALLILVALLLMVVGFAKPTHDIEVARQKATIYVAIDTSGSMRATDVSPSRLVAARTQPSSLSTACPRASMSVWLRSTATRASSSPPPPTTTW
jgi:Ca-activated chloride channel family protein